MREFLGSFMTGLVIGLIIGLVLINRIDLIVYPILAAIVASLASIFKTSGKDGVLGGYSGNGADITSAVIRESEEKTSSRPTGSLNDEMSDEYATYQPNEIFEEISGGGGEYDGGEILYDSTSDDTSTGTSDSEEDNDDHTDHSERLDRTEDDDLDITDSNHRSLVRIDSKNEHTDDIRGGKVIFEYFPDDFLRRDSSKHIKKRYFNPDEHLREILQSEKMPEISHIFPDAEKNKKFSRILDLSKRRKYAQRIDTFKPALHWGQLKLFLSEVEFLTLAIKECPDKELWFVYAGSAPGNHLIYLSELFPKIHFELYDPNDFVVKDTDMIKTHKSLFTDEDAKLWANSGKTVIFGSNIRSSPATQETILRIMQMQLNWWKIINPELSMFKFRLPWEPGKTEYPDGDIYIQAYPGPSSSETRLICKKDAKLRQYDNTEYEDACFYHNTVSRTHDYTDFTGIVLDRCYDCASYEHIMREYMTISDKTGSSKAGLSFEDLVYEVEKEITQGRNSMKGNTVRQIMVDLDHLYRMQWEKCRVAFCDVCINGEKKKTETTSKATLENEQQQLSKMSPKKEGSAQLTKKKRKSHKRRKNIRKV